MSRRPKPSPPDLSSSEPDRPEAPPLRLLYRLDELAAALGMSRRTVERLRSARRFPKPDLTVGRLPMWRIESIQRWIDSGGRGVS
jgi:predicted DNA-binding transcriptional regulator AlpA